MNPINKLASAFFQNFAHFCHNLAMLRQTNVKFNCIYYSYLLRFLERNVQHSRSGFTLIELLIVVIFIGIFAAIAFPSYMAWIDNTKYAQAKTQMNCTAKELQVFKLEKGYFPADTARNVLPVGIYCFYLQNSQQVPFNSMYDYENWAVAGGGRYIQITFLGKNKSKEFPNNNPLFPLPGFYDYPDDLVLSLGIIY